MTNTTKPPSPILKVWDAIWTPLLSVFVALLIAGIILIITGANPLTVYVSLLEGAFLKPGAFAETLTIATPYILLGLGVSLGFTAGLFNIGAEGQFYMGAVVSTYIGYAVTGLPAIIHLPLAIIGGALAGAVWAGIAGYFKATRGAHEVITTIMLNYIAFALTDYLINGPLRGKGSAPRTPDVLDSAILPKIFSGSDNLHWGFILALIILVGYWFLTKRMPLGLQIRTVGANPDAARYAGINVNRTTVVAMLISGALCGIAGATEVLGRYQYMPAAFTAGYGFDAIAISLLGQGSPIGVLIASVLFGAMNAGSGFMQLQAGVTPAIISVLQAFIIIFVAAPAIIRSLFKKN
ncbi:MAG: ABC transporter permease [Anaerolineae bacterium]|nr:ABC transporter permease [Anaerolineae bacterium]